MVNIFLIKNGIFDAHYLSLITCMAISLVMSLTCILSLLILNGGTNEATNMIYYFGICAGIMSSIFFASVLCVYEFLANIQNMRAVFLSGVAASDIRNIFANYITKLVLRIAIVAIGANIVTTYIFNNTQAALWMIVVSSLIPLLLIGIVQIIRIVPVQTIYQRLRATYN